MDHNKSTDQSQSKDLGKQILNILNQPIVSTVVGGLLLALILAILTQLKTFAEIPSRITALEERIETVEIAVGIADDDKRDAAEENNPAGNNSSPAVMPLGANVALSDEVKMEILNMSMINTVMQGGSDAIARMVDPVAYDEETQKEYTVAQLADKKVLLNYTENEQDIVFYGQFDENGLWTGNCIINIYKSGKLNLITEADYDRGNLLTFQQAFPEEEETAWYFSKRTMEKGFSSGETWEYSSIGNYEQTFPIKNMTAEDVVDIASLRPKVCGALEGYYSGNISDGRYNDDTGTACLVKYFPDGTVRTLYVGKVKDGKFEDSTGNAWMIGRMDTASKYSYYKCVFKNGVAKDKPLEQDISLERIGQLLQGMTFGCGLKWAD